MPFRGRGGGNFRGGGRGGGNRFNEGPPDSVVEIGSVMHPCQEDLVCRCTNEKVSYLENTDTSLCFAPIDVSLELCCPGTELWGCSPHLLMCFGILP